ncbi:hypothetical protein KTO58_14865 [Chitinophaga pendula]|uniref:hypothetical protein n=1 Tax=Chitinophaga TaxID=79328 RepID=UPI000BB0B31E|nr:MULTISPECIES: hypothetical protein [Chitinophaga]ASZ11990.1 hypothetical protein CK934_13990 [Chitinophaga sp. MD30]UCJ04982.1 hypothetical protein KTO58_14865 [Chitinophaga pendula]
MKSTLYTAVAALLIFSSCTTAYQTARTPDDVYYSPRSERTYASNNNRDGNYYQQDGRVVQGTDDDSNYVTYDDGEKGDYARRIERFRNPYNGSYYDDGYAGSPNIYMNNYYGSGFGGSGLGLGFGWGSGWGSPWYNSWGPSISLGFNWGWGSGFYRPWYDPWYGGGWYGGGWGSPWYPHAWGGGGWGYPGWGGWHGGPVYIVNTPPRRTRGSYSGNDYPAPRRSFGDSGPIGNGGNNGGYRPRRVFAEENGGGVNNPGGRTYTPGNNGYQPRRVFNSAPSERPVIGNQPSNNGGFQPRRVFQETSRPQPQMQQPQRSYSPSYSPSPSSGGGGGGGSRGGAGRTRG